MLLFKGIVYDIMNKMATILEFGGHIGILKAHNWDFLLGNVDLRVNWTLDYKKT